MTKNEVKKKLKELLPNHYKLFYVDECDTGAGNGTTEIRVCIRFSSTFTKNDDFSLEQELLNITYEFKNFVLPKLQEIIDELI